MSAPMNEPAQDATWVGSGIYVQPAVTSLTTQGVTSAPTGFAPPRNQLGEDDYAPDRFASGADVDLHRYAAQYHPEFYVDEPGEENVTGPKPYPA